MEVSFWETLPMREKNAILSECEAEQSKIRTVEAAEYIEIIFLLSVTIWHSLFLQKIKLMGNFQFKREEHWHPLCLLLCSVFYHFTQWCQSFLPWIAFLHISWLWMMYLELLLLEPLWQKLLSLWHTHTTCPDQVTMPKMLVHSINSLKYCSGSCHSP